MNVNYNKSFKKLNAIFEDGLLPQLSKFLGFNRVSLGIKIPFGKAKHSDSRWKQYTNCQKEAVNIIALQLPNLSLTLLLLKLLL